MNDEELRRNLELDAAVRRAVADINFGAVFQAEGVTAVSLDPAGHMLRTHPDGTVTQLD